ncbi:MAG: hypothetical protein ACRYGA_02205 [Janthinobacterium lividum]
MDKSLSLIVAMREIFGEPPLTESAMRAYFYALKDLPDDAVAELLLECLKAQARVPFPCEIRQACSGLATAKAGAGAGA